MTVVLAIYNIVRAYILLHQALMVTLGLAAFSSIIEMVMYRRGEGRKIKGPMIFWMLTATSGYLIKGWLWMAVFLQIIGWPLEVAILVIPVIYILNTAFTLMVNWVLSKCKGQPFLRRVLSILFAIVAIVLELRWYPVLIFPVYQDQIDWLIVHAATISLSVVGVVLAGRLLQSYLLLLMPREVNALRAEAAELKGSAELLPARGWVSTNLLTFQKFLFQVLTANFFAGGVFLENSVTALLEEIRKWHLRVFGFRFRLAKIFSR